MPCSCTRNLKEFKNDECYVKTSELIQRFNGVSPMHVHEHKHTAWCTVGKKSETRVAALKGLLGSMQ